MSQPTAPPRDARTRLLPLVIGVTGHRDLRTEDVPRLEEAVRKIFADLRGLYPKTPLVLLSALAEGADRLAARVALEKDVGVRLVATLPMSPEQYKEDFPAHESQSEFDEFLKQARPWFVVEGGNTGASTQRADLYERVGVYVARHCQVLIALWDGEDSEQKGGTSAVVRFQLVGAPEHCEPMSSPLDLPETGPVYQIVCPRLKNPDPPNAFSRKNHYPRALHRRPPVSPVQALFPTFTSLFRKVEGIRKGAAPRGPGGARMAREASTDKETAAAYSRIFRRLETFNGDCERFQSWLAPRQEKCKNTLLPPHKQTGLAAPVAAELERFAIADALGNHNRVRMFQVLHGLLYMALAWSILFYTHVVLQYGHEANGWWWRWGFLHSQEVYERLQNTIKTLYLIAFCSALLLLAWAELVAQYHSKYLDYRALAEGLRVQLFWRIAGITDSVADHYLRKQKSELEWVRGAVRVGQFLEGPQRALANRDQAPVEGSGLAIALTHWVKDQKRFFTFKAGWNYERSVRMRALGMVSLLAFICLGFVREMSLTPNHLLVLMMTLVGIGAGLLGIFARVHAFSEHKRQYGWMSLLFSNARRRLAVLLWAERQVRRGCYAEVFEARERVHALYKASKTELARDFEYFLRLWDRVAERLGGPQAPDPKAVAGARRLIVDEAQAILRELGTDALAENGDWVLLHGERSLELPQA
jgi:hypothetical protein